MGELILAGDSLFPVGHTTSDAEQRLRNFLRDREAYADNTFRDLVSVIRIYADWCRQRGAAWFPIEEELARMYLIDMYENGLASTTVDKHYAMLNMLLKQAGLPTLADSQSVSLAMRKIRRDAGTGGEERTGQAIPLRLDDLRLLNVLLQRSGRTVDLRNLTFLFVAYNTLLRISEIGRIRVRDLEMESDNVTINVSHTKTIVSAAGLTKSLSGVTSGLVIDWLEKSGLADHPDAILFPPVRKNGAVAITENPMSTPAMEKIFSDAWLELRREPAKTNKGRYSTWTGHSARVGAAQDMSDHGTTLVEIMREGTWRSPATVMGYLRKTKANKGAMSKLLDESDT
jgi:integrase